LQKRKIKKAMLKGNVEGRHRWRYPKEVQYQNRLHKSAEYQSLRQGGGENGPRVAGGAKRTPDACSRQLARVGGKKKAKIEYFHTFQELKKKGSPKGK